MTEELIEFPRESHQWFLQATYSTIIFVVAVKFSSIAIAALIVIAFNARVLAKPALVLINPRTKVLHYRYRKPFAFRKTQDIDLSVYSRIYSQIDSYASRSLHLSGPKGEHLLLAKFNQTSNVSQSAHPCNTGASRNLGSRARDQRWRGCLILYGAQTCVAVR